MRLLDLGATHNEAIRSQRPVTDRESWVGRCSSGPSGRRSDFGLVRCVGSDRSDVQTRYTVRGTAYLLHRLGWSVQVPAHRAVERDQAAIATWRWEAWPARKR
jgi:hypothetical protein